jgi:hypothetical protein
MMMMMIIIIIIIIINRRGVPNYREYLGSDAPTDPSKTSKTNPTSADNI